VIAFLEGHVLQIESGFLVVKTGGVGYQIIPSKKDLDMLIIGQQVAFYVYTHVREDAFELYGFINPQDKQIFQLLISVSGVGPKLGLAIISSLKSHELVTALGQKDLPRLSSISGIGKKTAERLCLELQDKIFKLNLSYETPEDSNIISLGQAIKSLGYSKEQSDRAVKALDPDDLSKLPLETLVKKTLALLAGKVS